MRFIILTTQRTGSSWLVNTLDNIPAVICFGELFIGSPTIYSRGKVEVPNFLYEKPSLKGLRPFTTFSYLNRVFNMAPTTGFKFMYSQFRANLEIVPYLLTHKVAVIHLIRRNMLNSVLSKLVAQERGQFHYREGEPIPAEKPILVDPNRLVRAVREIDRKVSWMRRGLSVSGLRHIQIYYEDLVADKGNFEPVWNFLGIDFQQNPPQWQAVKGRQKPPSEAILNFPEVSQALTKAGYAHLLTS